MRILQAMAGAEYGGAEAFFVRLTSALARVGVEQKVVIREHARRSAALRDAGLDVIELPFGGAFDFKTGPSLKGVIRTFDPQLVLSWMNRASKFCPKAKKGLDFVHVGRLGGYYDLKYYKHCHHLIGNTEDIVGHMVDKGWPKDRAHYLPNFVAEDRVPPVDRRTLHTPEHAELVLAMGRLHQNKAFDVLLNALPLAPNVYLWIAGEGPLRDELEKMAEKLSIRPRVRFLGWREDTAALLAACDVFVCPSRHEPLGNVVIEAWAQGKPVVAADSLGPGTLIDNMETGVLVPTDAPKELGQAIRAVTEDQNLAQRLAAAGRAAYEAQFTEASVVAQYMDFFQKVLTPGDSSP